MSTAATLLAGAMAGGEDGLSSRDCWLCLGQLYSQGHSAQTQLNSAISSGFDRLSNGDLLKCLAWASQSGNLLIDTSPTLSQSAANPAWTWAFASPSHWILEVSLNGVSGWAHVDTIDGSVRTADDNITPGSFYRIYGADSAAVRTTGISNILTGS